MRCCICGGERDVKYCSACGHNFCGDHRNWFRLTGVWERGSAAVKQALKVGSGTPYCYDERGNDLFLHGKRVSCACGWVHEGNKIEEHP